MKIVTVLGARPQFVKAAMVSKALLKLGRSEEVIVHTGQHYDASMSDIFFEELGIPEPQYNLNVGSGSHGAMTGRMLAALEEVLVEERPGCVLIYGDTNSTLAGALAAAKLHIPVAHVEAGLRSFNRAMPEEINRVVADHLSDILFCPTNVAVENLTREGLAGKAYNVGDVMYDAALQFRSVANENSSILKTLALAEKGFALATCHRAENTDDPVRLSNIMGALSALSTHLPVVLPLHPRTQKRIEEFGLAGAMVGITTIPAVGYVDMVRLEASAQLILTDSGGVQKEAFFFGVPCVTMRDETEWTETVDAGWNILAGASKDEILSAADQHTLKDRQSVNPYGSGCAAEEIAGVLTTTLLT
jgi:UDP-GlcNAc3NAcA epimerase